MTRIWALPGMRDKVAAVGLIPIDIASIDGMRGYIRAENEKWGALVRQLGLQGSQ
jgi:hypothetical protein